MSLFGRFAGFIQQVNTNTDNNNNAVVSNTNNSGNAHDTEYHSHSFSTHTHTHIVPDTNVNVVPAKNVNVIPTTSLTSAEIEARRNELIKNKEEQMRIARELEALKNHSHAEKETELEGV